MSSLARKRQREMRRKLAMKGITNEKLDNITEAVKSLDDAKSDAAYKATKKVLDTWAKEKEPAIKAATRGDVLVRLVAFMRDTQHYGKQRLERFMHDFMVYMNDIKNAGITNTQIIEAIKEETGFDMRDGLKEAQKQCYADSKAYARIERKAKKEGVA